ncbi:MAG: aminotransferase class V-fold PLP-dependent enzyme [Flavobacteriales bacterium]|nr:aminotransferase class V-fold PLP-dependent enzyme [Flavobacteriales bacterium]
MSEIIDKLAVLETVSKKLEPNEKIREEIHRPIINYAQHFLNTVNQTKVYNKIDYEIEDHFPSDFDDQGEPIEKAINHIRDYVHFPGLNPASGGHLGYIPGGGIYTAALGDYLADIANDYAGVDFASPGGVAMENSLIQWMAKLVGYPETCGGNLTSGGSIANLIAVTTAREAHNIKSANIPKTVIYLSKQAHHCVDKAIRIAGLKECILRYIEINEKFQIVSEGLDKQIKKDISNGLQPFMVIASAGTTDVGAIDPLSEIGKICKTHNLWYHIDAAYGGFFILTEEGKEKLKGIELSDSVVLDPHKGLFLPYGLGTIIIKNKKKMHEAHHYDAAYLQDVASTDDVRSPAELSPELTKPFRGLRLWLPLKVHGVNPFKACLEEKLLLTKYFVQEIQKIDGFEIYLEPELSVATYRYVPKTGDANLFNEALVKTTHEDGRVFISSTTVNGVFVLRLAVLSFRTHKDTIDLAIEVLRDGVEKVLSENTFAETVN